MILIKLFLTFFKIGLFTFGGGYAMLPLIQDEVISNQWIESTDFVNFIAVSESTPGPFAINISTYIGSQLAGIPGAVCATLGVVMPSFIVILIVAQFFEKFKNSTVVRGCMCGLKPAVIGLIGSAVVSMGITVFAPTGFAVDVSLLISAVIFISMLVAALKKIHPIIIICISAAAGIIAGFALNL